MVVLGGGGPSTFLRNVSGSQSSPNRDCGEPAASGVTGKRRGFLTIRAQNEKQGFRLFRASNETECFDQNRQKMQNRRWGVDRAQSSAALRLFVDAAKELAVSPKA